MILKILGSSSKGNCYILENDNEAIIIECGVDFAKIKKALNYKIAKVAGCLVTHEHNDHNKCIAEVMQAGINVVASKGTLTASGVLDSSRALVIGNKEVTQVGNFKIMAFDVKHDAAEPLGFIIFHPETGSVLFLTDTYYSGYVFKNLNNMIIECNYSQAIIDKKVVDGASPEFLRNRILTAHMELNTCKDLLRANDLSRVNNIVLIHLSDSNSDAQLFQREITELTGKTVHVADAGIFIDFNKQPF